MTEEIPQPKFKKGDIIRVVDEPYEDCPFGWIGAMDDYCGQSAVITSVTWNERAGAWGYAIDIDEDRYIWCENCFIEDYDIEESDVDVTTLFV